MSLTAHRAELGCALLDSNKARFKGPPDFSPICSTLRRSHSFSLEIRNPPRITESSLLTHG
jgi:hypothetical protein